LADELVHSDEGLMKLANMFDVKSERTFNNTGSHNV
jgi:hypothetical protein